MRNPAMHEHNELFRVVREEFARLRRSLLEDLISQGHTGRPQRPFTGDMARLLRRYRNQVSGSPAHLIDAALEAGEEG